MIITHRGRNTKTEENTIAAFERALQMGAEGVECDLRLTLDNKIVVHHNRKIMIHNRKIAVSKTLFKYVDKLLSLDDLFTYITGHNNIHFFLEIKSSSEILVKGIIKEIAEKDLWSKVNIIGFSFFIGRAIRLQSRYPKLRVWQLINIPLYSYIRMPRKSYGVMLGWFDSWFGSGWLFRRLISVRRLAQLKEFYEKNGFKVIGGVVNRKSGFRYFEQAGIEDIVTDNVGIAVNYFKHQ